MSVSSDDDSDFCPGRSGQSRLSSSKARTSTQKPKRARYVESEDSEDDFSPTESKRPKANPGPRLSREEKMFQKQLALALQASAEGAQPDDSASEVAGSLSPLRPEPELPIPTRPVPPVVSLLPEPELPIPTCPVPPVVSPLPGPVIPPPGQARSNPNVPRLPVDPQPRRDRPSAPPRAQPRRKSAPIAQPRLTSVQEPARGLAAASTAVASPPAALVWQPPRFQAGRPASSPTLGSTESPVGFRPRVGLSRNVKGIKPLHAKVNLT